VSTPSNDPRCGLRSGLTCSAGAQIPLHGK
jgi:hypothetical protein